MAVLYFLISKLHVWLFFCAYSVAGDKPAKTLTIGVLTPYNSELGACAFGSLLKAVDYIKTHVNIKGYALNNMKLEVKDSECDGAKAAGRTVILWKDLRANVIMGVPCVAAARASAELNAFWERPILSWYAHDVELKNKTMFPTLVRTFPPIHKMLKPLLKLLMLYRWSKIGVLVAEGERDMNLWRSLRDEISGRQDVDLLHHITCSYSNAGGCLKQLKTKARVILLMVPSTLLPKYMNEANKLDMGNNSDYIFIHYHWLDGMKTAEELWEGPVDGYWDNLLLMTIKLPPMEKYMEFIQEAIDANPNQSQQGQGQVECTRNSSAIAHLLTGYMFDTLVYYVHAKQYTEQSRKSWTDFQLWTNELNGNTLLQYKGKTGVLKFDDQGDREGEYSIKHYQHGGWKEVATIESAEGQPYQFQQELVWQGSSDTPSDTPSCGFDGRKCTDLHIGLGSMATVLVIVVASIGGYFYYKHVSRVKEIYKRSWVVESSDIRPLRQSHGGQTPSHSKGHGSHPRKRLKRMATRYSNSLGAGSTLSMDQSSLVHADTARYKSDIVVVKSLRMQFKTNRETLENLQTLYRMKAENINGFIGATIGADPVLLMAYCEKGSIQDILENDDIKLDSMFVLSFLSDIAKGMKYLHTSSIGSNGNLKSTNCVVDSRWVVKITDIGIVCQGGKIPKSGHGYLKISENDYFGGLLWTAPELLRNRTSGRGTQEGDIYSFSIIIQEVITRSKPFHNNIGFSENSYKDIIEMVQNGASNGHLCRPLVFEDAQDAFPDCRDWPKKFSRLEELMRACWAEDPEERPVFTVIKEKLKAINDGGKTMLVDHMVAMLEKYADNLEELVEDRTDALEQEKEKTDNLLNSMLPRQVADKLKLGLSVAPESFDAVSIFFSDIVGFTAIASQSEPLEIVSMLNKLYTLFDEIIGSYEVYKVETIGDAYMVCSGLPERIDYHAHEIACMALDFLCAVRGFVIDHLPDTQLKLRIGLHTGPCVAGVVGIAMPRYCLFGDTVNMASRMESTGEALKIHCSLPMNKELLALNRGFIMQKRGKIEVKGKGKQVTYWLLGKEGKQMLNELQHSLSDSAVSGNLQHMDDIDPSDSISNAPRRGSDMSGYTDGNAYVVLDLPDNSNNHMHSDSETMHKSFSVRSLGDVIVDRNSNVGSTIVTGERSFHHPDDADDIGDTSDLRNQGGSETRHKTRRKSSFQQAKTAIMQRTERIRKRSVGKVRPIQVSLNELSLPKLQTSPDTRKFDVLPEADVNANIDPSSENPLFVRVPLKQDSPSDHHGSKRHSMQVMPTSFPPLTKEKDVKQSPQSDSGRRGRHIGLGGIVNPSFTKVPDIRIKDYVDSDDDISV